MSVEGDKCRKTRCRGEISRQSRLDGSEGFVCDVCGRVYSRHGALLEES